MNCKDVVRTLAFEHVQVSRELREHLRTCTDCRLLVRITGSPKVIELPAVPRSPRTAGR